MFFLTKELMKTHVNDIVLFKVPVTVYSCVHFIDVKITLQKLK